ncbi:MAG: hypothetical protein KC505_04980, partial [Myxococcales bacterium]|nr:hypothetical protein [Myxococcales bacterium]
LAKDKPEIISLKQISPKLNSAHSSSLNNNSVLEIIGELLKNKYLDLPSPLMDMDNIDSCLKVRALSASLKGVHSGQLFSISYNQACLVGGEIIWRPLYILKETTKGPAEIKNLFRVKQSILGEKRISTKQLLQESYSSKNNSEALISFDDMHFSITNKSQTRYFSLLQTAKGRSLHSILVEFGNHIEMLDTTQIENSPAYRNMQHMFYRIGFATSKLHQKFSQHSLEDHGIMGKTLIHGDFHAQNIFYATENGDVTLIDNETYAMSLKHKSSGINDVIDLYLLHSTKTFAHYFAKQIFTNADFGINDQIWHQLWQQLVIGYIEAYDHLSAQQQMSLLDEIAREFKKGLSNRWLLHPYTKIKDQRKLKRLGPSKRRIHLRKNMKKFFASVSELMVQEQQHY